MVTSNRQRSSTPVRRFLVAGALLLLLGRTALRVEDGQFTREYSRLYTVIVLLVGLVLLLLVGVGLWKGARRLR